MSKQSFKAGARNRNGSSGGFTLTELLVVVTIIVLLISLLIPSVQNVANMGLRASCFQNMYKIGTLNQEYADTNNGYVVPAVCRVRDQRAGTFLTTSFDECLREINSGTDYNNPTTGIKIKNAANLYQCPAGPTGWLPIGSSYTPSVTPPNLCVGTPPAPQYPLDPPPNMATDGGSYALNIHKNVASGISWDGASWLPTTNIGLKTSQWADPGGTILLFETWRNGGWQETACISDVSQCGGPMIASGMSDACIVVWQNKHLGKGNLLFCDGHGENRFMGDSKAPAGETVGTGTANTCFTVRGMWTRAGGD